MESFSASRWVQDKRFFEQKINELGAEVIVRSSDGNAATQYKQAIELMNEGIDVLVVIASNADNAALIVREAHKREIKVIAYDRLINNCNLDYYIAFDGEYVGALQANYALARKPKGNYVLIAGDRSDNTAVLTRKGQLEALKNDIEDNSISIIYDIYVEAWSPEEAAFEFEKAYQLSNKPIDAVLVGNDGMASGVIKVLEKYNLTGKVIVTGLDAELDACRRILDGTQSMTVYTSIRDIAFSAAELAVTIAQKKKPKNKFISWYNGRVKVPAIMLKPIAVDKENLDEVVIKDNFHPKDSIYLK